METKEKDNHECTNFTHIIELDVYPYGDNIEYDKCTECGEKHNLNFL
jgi:hypothetical protein